MLSFYPYGVLLWLHVASLGVQMLEADVPAADHYYSGSQSLAAVVGGLEVLQGCVQHPIDSDCDNVAFCC